MALEEIAVNTVTPSGNDGNIPSNAKGDTVKQLLGPEQEPTRAASPAFHSMLRTATETGDLGVFGINPSLLPQLNPHALPRGKRSAYRQPGASGHSLPQGESYGLSNSGSQRTSQATSVGPRARNGRSYSMTDSYHLLNPPFTRHRSYANPGGYGGALDLTRPRSPFAYPSRFMRPGYRPHSPALSDQVSPGYRTTSGAIRRPKMRIRSPSAYGQGKVPSGYRRGLNYHLPPFPANAGPSLGTRLHDQHIGRATTPKSSIYRRSYSSSVNGYRSTVSQYTGPKDPPAPALFYDYTEGFEEDFNVQDSRSGPSWPLFTIDATIPEAQSSGTDLNLKATLDTQQVVATLPVGEVVQDSAGGVLVRHSSFSSHSSLPAGRVSFTNSNLSRAGSSFSSPIVSSPDQHSSLESFKEFKDTHHGRNCPTSMPAARASALFAFPAWRLPSLDFSRVDLAERPSGPSLARASSIDGLAETDHAGIFAPVPERPLTSQGHRETYNSFFRTEEDLAELVKVLTTFESTDRPYTPDEFIRHSHRSSTVPRNSPLSLLSRQSAKVALTTPGEPAEETLFKDSTPLYGLRDGANIDTSNSVKVTDGNLQSSSTLELPSASNPDSQVRSPCRTSYFVGRGLMLPSGEPEVKDEDSYFYPHHSPVAQPPSYINDDIAAHIRPRKASLIVNQQSSQVSDANIVEPFPLLDSHGESIEVLEPAPLNNSLPLTEGIPTITVRKSSLQSARSPTVLAPGSSFPHLSKDLSSSMKKSSGAYQTMPAKAVLPQLHPPITLPRPTSSPNLKDNSAFSTVTENMLHTIKDQGIKQKFRVKRRSIKPPSRDSSIESRPWNDDESYPWTDIPPDIEMRLPPPPPPAMHRERHINKTPLFKIGNRKLSAATDATVRINRNTTTDLTIDRPISAPTDLFVTMPKVHGTQKLFGSLGRRFGYNSHIENQVAGYPTSVSPVDGDVTHQAPSVRLAAPSPTLNPAEVRSFFSDDSSMVRNRGSVRQRFSQFRSRLPSSRKSSSDEVRDMERNPTAFSYKRGRLSRRASEDYGQETIGMSNIEYKVRKVVETVKGWFQKVREIGGRKRGKEFQASSSIELQASPVVHSLDHRL